MKGGYFIPLVKARCTSCDGELDVDQSKEAAICPYCGTPYIVEKAINNYIINNAPPTINQTAYLNNAFSLIKLGAKGSAQKILEELTKNSPNDWRVWLALDISYWKSNTTFHNEQIIRKLASPEILQKLGNMRILTKSEEQEYQELLSGAKDAALTNELYTVQNEYNRAVQDRDTAIYKKTLTPIVIIAVLALTVLCIIHKVWIGILFVWLIGDFIYKRVSNYNSNFNYISNAQLRKNNLENVKRAYDEKKIANQQRLQELEKIVKNTPKIDYYISILEEYIH